MPLSDYRYPSGLRVHAGEKGQVYANRGAIYFARAPVHGPDANLFGALKWLVDHLECALQVSSVDTGQHVPSSRHYVGLAADLSRIGPSRAKWTSFTVHNELGLELVRLCLASGWHIGEGHPEQAGILLGPVHTQYNTSAVDHADHCHISIARHAPVGVE